MNSESKWKDFVLRTGLPLEYEVSEILRSLGFEPRGEYPFIRENENKIECEFSVDLWADKTIKPNKGSSSLQASCLVECKYSHQGVNWLFIPNNTATVNPIIKVIDHNTEHINEFYDFDDNFICKEKIRSCSKGIEILPKDASEFIIKKGINQLKYALPNFASLYLDVHYNVDPKSIAAILPILVTTADIFVLHEDVKTKDILRASSLDNIAKKVNLIRYSSFDNPLLDNYSQYVLSKFLSKNVEFLDIYIANYENIFPDNYESGSHYLQRFFKEISREIIVCNKDYLQQVLTIFLASLK